MPPLARWRGADRNSARRRPAENDDDEERKSFHHAPSGFPKVRTVAFRRYHEPARPPPPPESERLQCDAMNRRRRRSLSRTLMPFRWRTTWITSAAATHTIGNKSDERRGAIIGRQRKEAPPWMRARDARAGCTCDRSFELSADGASGSDATVHSLTSS